MSSVTQSSMSEAPAHAIAAEPGIVSLEEVSVRFGVGPSAYEAVAGVTLEIAAGEFVAIVGPTGCGKSTLLNVVAGLLAPAAGLARVHGRRVAGVTAEAGYLFQQDALMPWKTALANVAVALEVGGVAAPEARASGTASDTRSKTITGMTGLAARMSRIWVMRFAPRWWRCASLYRH